MDDTRHARARSLPWLCCAMLSAAGAARLPADPLVFMPTADVFGADAQPNGPGYDYTIGVYEVTNAQFVMFLNDALGNLANERGQYLYFDIDSGDVYLHTSRTGTTGTAGAGTPLFSQAVNGVIVFQTGAYWIADSARQHHPATGVSWYGALKFCNWLTIDLGLTAANRAYTEGPVPADWHPVTIDTVAWSTRELNAAERQQMADTVRGFRLPMDEAASASAYNEWFKAAAWTGAADSLYGFGRNTITGADANYLGSGDPFEPGATPVGLYNGVVYGTDTDNYYGLYDLSGNVWEWMQDQRPAVPAERAVRGGSWNSSAASLLCTTRTYRTASSVSTTTGFRVAMSMPAPLVVVPDAGMVASGPLGGPYTGQSQFSYTVINVSSGTINGFANSDAALEADDWSAFDACCAGPAAAYPTGDCSAFDYDGDGNVDLLDFARFQRGLGGDWLLITAQPLGMGQTTVTVTVDTACDTPVALGVNRATVRFLDYDTGEVYAERSVQLTLTEPLSVTPAGDLVATGRAGGSFAPAQITWAVGSASASPIGWSATADSDWITINGSPHTVFPILGEVVPPETQDDVPVALDANAAATLPVGTHTARITFRDLCTDRTFTRQVRLSVLPSIAVTPSDDAHFEAVFGDPPSPPNKTYELENLSTDNAIRWEVVADGSPSWLNISTNGAGSTLAPQASVQVTITPILTDAVRSPGTYTTTLRFRHKSEAGDTLHELTRQVTLIILEFDVAPTNGFATSGPVGGPFDPAELTYTITHHADSEIAWRATKPATADWISLNGADEASGLIVQAGGTDSLTITIDADAARLPAGTHTADITVENQTTGARAVRTVTLRIGGSLTVAPPSLDFAGPVGGPHAPVGSAVFTLSAVLADTVAWSGTADQPWVLLSGQTTAGGSLAPAATVDVPVSIDPDAAAGLVEGLYTANVTFTTDSNGPPTPCSVRLRLGGLLSVDPAAGLNAYRLGDGSLVSAERVFTVTNLDSNGVAWEAASTNGWVVINHGLGASGWLNGGQFVSVHVSVDAAQAAAWTQDHADTVEFRNLTLPADIAARPVTVTLASPLLVPPPAMARVPGTDAQPSGPGYDFLIGVDEITNAQFVVFLNNALANPADERGQYLYFDTDTGDVYIHSEQTGAAGTTGSGTKIFDATASGRITFDGTTYSVTNSAYASHPVTGVTWYGAVKFCNWLTLDQGYGPDHRCYGEGIVSELNAWRPVTISSTDWATRLMTAVERQALVTGYRGFRLPMDSNASTAQAFNEWYKAAAWRPDLSRNVKYGFGRDTCSPADGNWLGSGDPFEPGTTPVGYYDGSAHDGFATAATANGYGLHDMTGNVFEWMQDRYQITSQAIRGGSWNYGTVTSPGIDATGRLAMAPASAAYLNQIGFRVVRVAAAAAVAGDADGDGDVDLADYAAFAGCQTGPGVAVPVGCGTFDLDVDNDIDLIDFCAFQRLYR